MQCHCVAGSSALQDELIGLETVANDWFLCERVRGVVPLGLRDWLDELRKELPHLKLTG